MKVVFPSPDSPATMIVKAAPRFATILCLSQEVRDRCAQAKIDMGYTVGSGAEETSR